MKHLSLLTLIITALSLVACKQRTIENRPQTTDSAEAMSLDYAQGFQVRTLENGVKLVDVADPQTDEDKMPVSYHFALVPRQTVNSQLSTVNDQIPEGYTKVEVPVERTLVMTMLQLSNFTALGALDVVKGITGTAPRTSSTKTSTNVWQTGAS